MSRVIRHVPGVYHYTYGPHAPVETLDPGDTIVTTTVDAANRDEHGREIPRSARAVRDDTALAEVNPVVGPFFVRGAEPGDALAVHIEEIRLNRDFVDGRASYDRGGLGWGMSAGLSLSRSDLPELASRYHWRIDSTRGTATLDLPGSRVGRVEIPMNPHFGCIGTAPQRGEVISTMTPGPHGGNMDCVETRAGTTVLLPVFARGAYLMFGDVHAAQGDGELCGGGLDITAEVTLRVELRKSWPIRWPRLENEQYLMVAASTLPLFDAYRLAQVDLINWLRDDYGYDPLDALHLITQVGVTRVGNVVDPLFTVVAKFPRQYLPG
jgi:amidase